MRPSRSIESKDTITEQRIKLLVSGAKAEILELRSEDSLDILWFNGGD